MLRFRLGAVVDARRRDGLELEEALRDPGGRNAPGYALLAAWSALLAGLAICALPPLALALATDRESPPALHPVHVRAAGDGAWSFDAGGPIASGSHLLLAFTWERAPVADAALVNEEGFFLRLEPGVLARSNLAEAEERSGVFTRSLNSDARTAGAALVRPLVRLEVPRPSLGSAPLLLLGQALFVTPLFALVLLLARRGRVGGPLAALTAVALAGLLAFDPFEPPRLEQGPTELLARAVLSLRNLFPDLRGLAAVGRGFELRSGTTTGWTPAIWIAYGLLAQLLISWKWRRER